MCPCVLTHPSNNSLTQVGKSVEVSFHKEYIGVLRDERTKFICLSFYHGGYSYSPRFSIRFDSLGRFLCVCNLFLMASSYVLTLIHCIAVDL